MLICDDHPLLRFSRNVLCSPRQTHGGKIGKLPQSLLNLCSLMILTPSLHSQRCYPTAGTGMLFRGYPTRAVSLTLSSNSRDHRTCCRGEPRGQPDWPPNGHVRTGPSPPVTPVRTQPDRPKVTAHLPLYNMRDAPLSSSATSTPSLISDQPPPARPRSLTPGLELAGPNCDTRETARRSPLPSIVHRTPGRCPTHHDGVSQVSGPLTPFSSQCH